MNDIVAKPMEGTIHRGYQLISPFGQVVLGVSAVCDDALHYGIKRPISVPTRNQMIELLGVTSNDRVTLEPYTDKTSSIKDVSYDVTREVRPTDVMKCQWCENKLHFKESGILICDNPQCKGRVIGRLHSFVSGWVEGEMSPFLWHDIGHQLPLLGACDLFNDATMNAIAIRTPALDITAVEEGLWYFKHAVRSAYTQTDQRKYPFEDLSNIVMSLGVGGLTRKTANLLVQHSFSSEEPPFPYLTDCLAFDDTLVHAGVEPKEAQCIASHAKPIQWELFSLGDQLSSIQTNEMYDYL